MRSQRGTSSIWGRLGCKIDHSSNHDLTLSGGGEPEAGARRKVESSYKRDRADCANANESTLAWAGGRNQRSGARHVRPQQVASRAGNGRQMTPGERSVGGLAGHRKWLRANERRGKQLSRAPINNRPRVGLIDRPAEPITGDNCGEGRELNGKGLIRARL